MSPTATKTDLAELKVDILKVAIAIAIGIGIGIANAVLMFAIVRLVAGD